MGLDFGNLFNGLFGGGGGRESPAPTAPSFQLPPEMQNYFSQMMSYIQPSIGQQLQMPSEYGQAGDVYSNLLNYKPDQFQFPMADINKALQAWQGIQLQDYMKRINPMLANAGQMDSTYAANVLGDYLKGQQAQSYGTNADLLTQQALNNMQIQQWLPQFQSGVAGQLQGLGGAKANIGQFNMQWPYQSYIPAYNNMFNSGMQLGQQNYNSQLVPYQNQWNLYSGARAGQQKQQSDLFNGLGSIANGLPWGDIMKKMPSFGQGGAMGNFFSMYK